LNFLKNDTYWACCETDVAILPHNKENATFELIAATFVTKYLKWKSGL
jgi:hypothetical protein